MLERKSRNPQIRVFEQQGFLLDFSNSDILGQKRHLEGATFVSPFCRNGLFASFQ